MSKKSLVWGFVLGQLFIGRVFSATISLDVPAQSRLAQFVKTNHSAQKLYRPIQREADASLNQSGHPVERISSSGLLAADARKIETLKSLKDMPRLQALGYAYAVTGEKRYSATARRIILNWVEHNQPTGHPIDETKLEPLLECCELTRNAFSAEERSRLDDWLRQIARVQMENLKPHSSSSRNNWNSHRLKIVGLIGFLLNDQQLIDWTVVGFKRQIETNLQADGSSFDFHERDALHYHCYDLEPLLRLALAAKLNGIDLYAYTSTNGASLGKSVDFLIPYCSGEKTHAEFVHSKVKFDHERAEAGEEAFKTGAPFQPRSAARVFELAVFFDDKYLNMAERLGGKPGNELFSWQALLNQIRKERA